MLRALDALDDSIIVLTPNWDYLYINRAGIERLDIHSEDIIGQNLWVLFPYLMGTPFEIACRKTAKDGRSREVEDYYSGKGVWYRSKIISSELGIILQVEDVTELKKTKAANQALVAILEDALNPHPVARKHSII
jgi:PAS domain-containing protein